MAFLKDPLRITVLGSGTSMGVPTIGCHCEVCSSNDPRDNRLRPSILVRYGGRNILIDTTPDFRTQALRAKINRLDAILFTHEHADHIMGLDDVRPFNFRQKSAIPIFGSEETLAAIRRTFKYIFDADMPESSIPKLETHVLDGSAFDLFGLEIRPLLLQHGRSVVYGYRFGSAAYLTDHSEIPPNALSQLTELDVLFLDALRYKPHPTHSTVERSIAYSEQLNPRRTYFTHICHELPHVKTENGLPQNIRLAYDGLEITVGEPA
jgi:phosphoribosyl 1,2-cyclic phosphate phosphodiesterase